MPQDLKRRMAELQEAKAAQAGLLGSHHRETNLSKRDETIIAIGFASILTLNLTPPKPKAAEFTLSLN